MSEIIYELMSNNLVTLSSSLILTNVLLIYMIEKSPRTKGTFIRPDDKGNRRFHIPSYINFVLSPINITKPNIMFWFWKPKNLVLNIPFYNISIVAGYYLATKLIKFI